MVKKRVSSKDVAREAGVSQATVSYVLNNVEGIKIKQETRDAVLRAVEKLNYYPNLIAKSMKLKKSMSIGIVTDKSISSSMFIKVLEGVKDILLNKNYSLTFCLNRSEKVETSDCIQYYNSNRIDGIIFAFTKLRKEDIEYLTENKIPYTIVNSNTKQVYNNMVRIDMEDAVKEAFDTLINKYGNNVVYIGTNANNPNSPRFLNFKKNMISNNLELDDEKIIKVPQLDNDNIKESSKDGCIQIEEIIRFFNQNKKGFVFCDSIEWSFFIAKVLKNNNIKVGKDVGVLSIGTSQFSEFSNPSISAVEAPLYDMGRKGCLMLFDTIEQKEHKEIVTLKWNFIERESTTYSETN